MPRGGARSVSGPPPDPNALKRERPSDKALWVTIPAGDSGIETPEFPLQFPEGRELELWEELWRMPQARMWLKLRLHYEVALFTRAFWRAELPSAKTDDIKAVRQFLDALGLSVQGMLRNRWRIVDGSAETFALPEKSSKTRRSTVKDRLRVIPNDDTG